MDPSSPHYPRIDFRRLYDRFDAPVTEFDCGLLCAPHNPSGLPFCCDICQAVPVAYRQEWEYLRQNTGLWHPWQGSECPADPADPADLREQTPDHMVLLACQGPAHCQRNFRAVSCRQFPFFPYITADDRFLGLACEWEFENMCWVISHLETVTRHMFSKMTTIIFLNIRVLFSFICYNFFYFIIIHIYRVIYLPSFQFHYFIS
ncbi:MAG TPA: hypothetical protein PLV53_00630 [Anaerolineaceae bacterium]|nr:hypothetical protein [Anaerolineaceae bacterium]